MNAGSKILIGTRDIANNIHMLRTGFQSLGYEVKTCSTEINRFYKVEPDLDISPLYKTVRQHIASGSSSDLRIPNEYKHLFEFDVYVFVTDSLLPGMLDLPLLSSMGKRIVYFPTGSDLRYWGNAVPFNKTLDLDFPKRLVSPQRNACRSESEMALQDVYVDTYSRKLHSTRMIEEYADFFYASPAYAQFAVRPYFGIMIPCDTTMCQPNIPERSCPVVVHAPSSRAKKRTSIILGALEQLKDEGIDFELRVVDGVDNQTVLRALSDCDVLVAQLGSGKAGLLCLEGLASGCCVLGPSNDIGSPIPYQSIPILNITNSTLLDRLREVLTNKAMRVELAQAGLDYMGLELHSPKNAAQYLIDGFARAESGSFDHYPTFFLEHSRPPEGEYVPEYLKQMTWRLMKKHGVSPHFSPRHSFMAKHLPEGVTPEMTVRLPRWQGSFCEEHFWGFEHEDGIYPHGPYGMHEKEEALARMREVAQKYA